MICFNNTIITSDIGIYKTLLKEKINVKLVTTKGILLNGYKNGFIGGSCGFISNDKLLFYGDVRKYDDYDIIKSVANKENVKLIFPKDTNFVDLGGFISLIWNKNCKLVSQFHERKMTHIDKKNRRYIINIQYIILILYWYFSNKLLKN